MDCPNCGHSGGDQVEYGKPCRRCGSSEHTKRADAKSFKAPAPAGVEIDLSVALEAPKETPEFSVDPQPPV